MDRGIERLIYIHMLDERVAGLTEKYGMFVCELAIMLGVIAGMKSYYDIEKFCGIVLCHDPASIVWLNINHPIDLREWIRGDILCSLDITRVDLIDISVLSYYLDRYDNTIESSRRFVWSAKELFYLLSYPCVIIIDKIKNVFRKENT